ncbi:hypothetical protein V495_00650 [Pseudogymnoascus sp. VKM F-4514 (FW-929)]|nr:hypothetical protein V495_00650 [Pseudogymnoascus sp. VKM F-4514 (FW-929)]KFY66145.1 hypothetical protein V497_01098 [Pseudogymnoascus sp. VKM F-4516 (FW-969)]
MRFLLPAIAVVLFASSGLCAPATEDSAAKPKAGDENWDWCAPEFACTDDYGCAEQNDCVQRAKGNKDNIHCGSGVYPHSCWTYYD